MSMMIASTEPLPARRRISSTSSETATSKPPLRVRTTFMNFTLIASSSTMRICWGIPDLAGRQGYYAGPPADGCESLDRMRASRAARVPSGTWRLPRPVPRARPGLDAPW